MFKSPIKTTFLLERFVACVNHVNDSIKQSRQRQNIIIDDVIEL